MTTYKLQITYQLDTTGEPSEAIKEALNILKAASLATGLVACDPQVALNRDGDRSAANLLAPVQGSVGHYKHGKVPITNVM